MTKMQTLLQESGYLVVNWGYPTFLQRIQKFAQPLSDLIGGMEEDEGIRSVSFVTHSFGAIVIRYILNQFSFAKVQRAVMLAPPNGGSQLTRFKLGPFRYLCPSIADISLSKDSLANQLGSPESIEVGVIAADSDFVVPISNTKLPNQADHCVVASSHFALPYNQEAQAKSLNFLRYGRFAASKNVPVDTPLIKAA